MNLNDYEKKYFSIYEDFAETVRFIIEKALLFSDNLPTPQSVKCRAKGIESLWYRLSEEGMLDTDTLECERRDLAGVRLIFYTNNDVDRFLASSLVRENFEIEDDSTKIHHPTTENKGVQYRAIHYTVCLRDDRIRLPEYAKFKGLRCEIQVQTILNHAWSETSHDILYKTKLGNGYGVKAIKDITRRFDRIMDEYLIPAGFEIQKAQQEYKRLQQGKILFDKDIANLLDNAQNNNDRYDILLGLRDYAIPNYDDLPLAFKELKAPLLRTVKVARGAATVPQKTIFGNIEGLTADTVTRLVVEIIESLLYVDEIVTLELLIDIYREEPNDHIRQQIENTVNNLSAYNIDTYSQVGPMLQMELLDYIANINDAEVDSIRPIALIVWSEAIKSEITGTKWKADEVVLSRAAIPASDLLIEVRKKAINALFAAYDRSANDQQKRAILSALDAATRMPIHTQYSNDLLATTLKDATRIVVFVTERAINENYELLQHLEHRFHYDYFLAKGFIINHEQRFNCQIEAEALMTVILKFRDTINANNQYVRYKVLIGFDSVYPCHWTDHEFDYQRADDYRREEVNSYIAQMNKANENEWFDLINRCAETKSNDLLTFPVFGNFISKLAERKPEVADRLLTIASENLYNFLSGFLNGLSLSARSDIYDRILEHELELSKNLAGLARHLRYSDISKPDFSDRLLTQAINKGETYAVNQCLLFALEYYGTERITDSCRFLFEALSYLNDCKNSFWVKEAWFMQKATMFYEKLTPEMTAKLLKNLVYLPDVDYQVERILVRLAEHQIESVWDYFGSRLVRKAEGGEDENHFAPFPFQFHGLEKELSKDPQLALTKGFSWFEQDSELFEFRGGRLLSIAFTNCTSEFATALAELVKSGGETEADFALAILRNYKGEESTHIVLKEIVSQFSEDISKLKRVKIVVDSTGVVSGELGFAEAWRAKKKSLEKWLGDERQVVKVFAEKHIVTLEMMIASEHRTAEAEREMRKCSYNTYDDDNKENS